MNRDRGSGGGGLIDPDTGALLSGWCTDIAAGGGRFGVLLVGDGGVRESLWQAITDRLGRSEVSAGLAGGGVAALPAADLLDPAAAAAVARAPRLLALAPALADVPAAVARRCTAVIELGPSVGSAGLAAALSTGTYRLPLPAEVVDRTGQIDVMRIVELLAEAGLDDVGLAIETCRLAACASAHGLDPVEVVRRFVIGPRVPDMGASPPGPAEPQEREPPGDPADPGDGDAADDDDPGAGDDGTGNREPADDGPDHPAEQPDDVRPAPPGPTRRRYGRSAGRWLPGRKGAPADHPVRGRPYRVVPVGRSSGAVRPAIVPTIAAATPWQPARQGPAPASDRLVILPEDLRGWRRRQPAGSFLIIVVDASGSMARRAIRRAKGLALATLDRAYVERRTVAIVVARGRQASLGLAPTRSTARARAALRALPTGGGTPLASAYLLAVRLAARSRPEQVEAIVLTDGRANVGIGGDPREDAARAAERLHAACRTVTHLDTDPG